MVWVSVNEWRWTDRLNCDIVWDKLQNSSLVGWLSYWDFPGFKEGYQWILFGIVKDVCYNGIVCMSMWDLVD